MALPPPVRRSAPRPPGGRSSPAGCRSCTGPRPPGPMSTIWPMTRSGTRWRPGTPRGRPSWSSGTSRRCFAAARARPCIGGFPRCPRSRYAIPSAPVPGPGDQRRSACRWKHSRRPVSLWSAERAFAVHRREPYEPSVARAVSVLANVPAGIAFLHAVLARLRGDAALAAALATGRPWRNLGEQDSLLRSFVRWNMAGARLAARPARRGRARPGGGARGTAGGW